MLRVSRDDIETDKITQYNSAERFIKLPIENYLKIVDRVPIKPQVALINAVNNPKYRFIVAALSRRTGKTYISNVIAQLVAYMPGTNILIMAPNYSLSQISWDLQRQLLNQFSIELERSNAKDKIIELKNGSTIRMGSVGQADSVVGRSYDLILFDEAALDDRGKEVFNIQLSPTLDKLNSKAIFISTPRGKNYFKEFFDRGFSEDYPNWVSIQSDYYENPRVPSEAIEQARRGMSIAEFNQEFLADFVSMEGQIWRISDDCVRDIDVSSIDRWDTIAGLDIGFKDATAFIVIITDGNNFYVVDEYQNASATTTVHAKAIQEMMDKWNIDFIYIDSAAQQTRFDFAMNFDISTVNANKSVLDGIGYVSSIIDHNRLFVDKSCKHTLDSLDNYVWDNREGLLHEKPKHSDYSHMADALRYAIYTHSYNVETI